MPAQDERKFVIFRAGQVRDEIILAHFRNALRSMLNPETGVTFTEDEIALATQPGSRKYIEADSIDLVCQLKQVRAQYLSEQLRPKTANTNYLENFHGQLWLGANSKLPAVGASGAVNAPATVGSVFPGSTTIGDPAAAVATDPNGLRFQVLVTTVTPSGGAATLTMKGVDTGFVTRILSGTILTWSTNEPLGAEPEATTTEDFDGGFDIETDIEYATRIEDRIAHKPAAGNNAHFVDWSRQANVAIEAAFVYATALFAGSVLVCVTEKRDTTTNEGPEARTDVAFGTLTDVTNFITPPNTPVMAQRAFVIVIKPTSQPSDIVLRISMGIGTNGGWADTTPWPNPPTGTSFIETKVIGAPTQTSFQVATDSTLPGGVASLTGDDVPQLMLWNVAESRFEKLNVTDVAWAADVATIELSPQPTFTIAVDDTLSPYTDRLTVIAESIEGYFDELGPGQVVDLLTDSRAVRAARYPAITQQYPSRAGQAVLSRLIDALGGVSPDAELTNITRNDPDVPTQIIDGPNMVTLGYVNIYPL